MYFDSSVKEMKTIAPTALTLYLGIPFWNITSSAATTAAFWKSSLVHCYLSY